MEPSERVVYGIRYIGEETWRLGRTAKKYGALHLVVGVLAILAGGAGFLAPSLGVTGDVSTRVLSLVAAILAFVQNTQKFDEQATRYLIAHQVMQNALTDYNLGLSDEAALSKAHRDAKSIIGPEKRAGGSQ